VSWEENNLSGAIRFSDASVQWSSYGALFSPSMHPERGVGERRRRRRADGTGWLSFFFIFFFTSPSLVCSWPFLGMGVVIALEISLSESCGPMLLSLW